MSTSYKAPVVPAIFPSVYSRFSSSHLQRSVTEESLAQDRERAALRLLALSSADIDEVLDGGGDGGWIGAVEVSHVEDVGCAALGIAVGAAADDGSLTGVDVGGGCWSGEGEARESGEGEDGEELHFCLRLGAFAGRVLWIVKMVCSNCLRLLCCAAYWMIEKLFLDGRDVMLYRHSSHLRDDVP